MHIVLEKNTAIFFSLSVNFIPVSIFWALRPEKCRWHQIQSMKWMWKQFDVQSIQSCDHFLSFGIRWIDRLWAHAAYILHWVFTYPSIHELYVQNVAVLLWMWMCDVEYRQCGMFVNYAHAHMLRPTVNARVLHFCKLIF